MSVKIEIALCQLNPTTGDFKGNFKRASDWIKKTEADIYVFPECYVSNYPAGDLFLHSAFVNEAYSSLSNYVSLVAGTDKIIVIGCPKPMAGSNKPENAVFVISHDGVQHVTSKKYLANQDGLECQRWFVGRDDSPVVLYHFKKSGMMVKLGFAVGKDIWFTDVTGQNAEAGADINISLSSTHYTFANSALRHAVLKVRETEIPLVYVNQVGGNDELIWDGGSCVIDTNERVFGSDRWVETVDVVTFLRDDGNWRLADTRSPDAVPTADEKYVAVCLALRDYVAKTGFNKVVLGLSGGADSALVALMAADVFGAENVDCLLMPTKFTSGMSNSLAADLAEGLGDGVKAFTIPVQPVFDVYAKLFAEQIAVTSPSVAEENLQAQMRGDMLSWYSNKFGHMILSTGNKSEIAMGYSTLYGDMRGGFNPLKDIYKTEVFELMKMRLFEGALQANMTMEFEGIFGNLLSSIGKRASTLAAEFEKVFGKPLVPMSQKALRAFADILNRPPSAELAEDQFDSDSLPDYDVLDSILWSMIDKEEILSNEQVAKITDQPIEIVEFVRRRLREMEYKRFQSCPGPSIHRRSFARVEWRYPMASLYRH